MQNDILHNPEDLTVYRRYVFSKSALFNESLPVSKWRSQILKKIASWPVIIIEAETGSGKTTQIPQMILHDAAEHQRYAKIIVTLPRKIAAISVSRRVCDANRWAFQPPGICGYQIGSEQSHSSADTRLLYCTTGVGLRKLMTEIKRLGQLQGHFTHVIIDDVHERDREMDLCLLLVKKYRRIVPTVKVILMSATIQAEKIADYFQIPKGRQSGPAPILKIEGRAHEVKEWYLDDLREACPGIQKPRLDVNDPHLNPECIKYCVRTIQNFSAMERGGPMGAVLVFLPGMQEIKIVNIELDRILNLQIIKLHSEISVEEQRKAFLPAESGFRKVILATNIAESSITVPDVTYVIDFCLNKVLFSDQAGSHLECLRLCWASKANCRQRAGRAGRVQDGRCYRLIDRQMYFNDLQDYPQPEILRASLCQTVLQVKMLDMGPPRTVLANAIDPPVEGSIHSAVLLCKEVQALTTPKINDLDDDRLSPEEKDDLAEKHSYDGELTYLGEILASLPVDVRLGKLIIFGHMFGVLEPCVIIAASLTVRSFFAKTYDREFDYHKTRLLYSNYSKSDLLTCLFAYEAVEMMHHGRTERNLERGIHRGRLDDVRYLVDDLKRRLNRFGIDFRDWTENLTDEKRKLRSDHRLFLIRLAIAAAFYPNYFLRSKQPDVDEMKRELSGLSHLNTIKVSNLPQNTGFFYHDKVANIFRRCICDPRQQSLRIFYEQSKAYVQFIDSTKPPEEFSNCVFLAVRMRMLKRETMPPISQYNLTALQQERECLFQEAREYYCRKNQLMPNLVMITEEPENSNTWASSTSSRESPFPVSERPIASLTSVDKATVSSALPGETTQLAKVEMTYLVSCCQFYARFLQINEVDSEDYNKIRISLSDPNKLQPSQIADLYEGGLYVARHPDHFFGFQRAKLETFIFDEEKVEVFFVDIGERNNVDVEQIYDCPPAIKDFDNQAVWCRLARTREIRNTRELYEQGLSKLARNQFEFNQFGKKCLKQFDAEVYSVVDDVVTLDLLAINVKTDETFSVGTFLVNKGYAEFAEETPESQADHNLRSRNWGCHPDSQKESANEAGFNYWPLRFSGINFPTAPSFEPSFNLRLMNQPAEMTWACPVYGYGEQTRIKVASDSVNCIAMEQFPTSLSPSLIIAASATKDDRSGGISLADTTLYPPKPGYPALLSMLFSPAVELMLVFHAYFHAYFHCFCPIHSKGSRQQEYPIGILCGLGPDPTSMHAVLADHDFFLTLDTKLTEQDYLLISSIRENVNLMIDRKNPVIKQNAPQFRGAQQKMIEAAIELFQFTERTYIEPDYPKARYVTWALRETAKQPGRNALHDISTKMHDGVFGSAQNASYAFGQQNSEGAAFAESHRLPAAASIENDQSSAGSLDELENNLKQLKLVLLESADIESVSCLVCNQKANGLHNLRLHMASSKHTRNVDLVNSRIAAETAGQRESQSESTNNVELESWFRRPLR